MSNYLIASNSFVGAAQKAAEMNLHITDWEWHPMRTVHSGVLIFTRNIDE